MLKHSKKILSLALALLMIVALLPTFALAQDTSSADALAFDAESALTGTYTVSGVEYKNYQVAYCTNPITGKTWGGKASADFFKMNIKVPTSLSDTEAASAPILFYNPWGGDNGAAVPAADASLDALKTAALQRGWILVEPGMRGNNCYDGTIGEADYVDYGKLPYPLADLKAAVSYLHHNAGAVPGDTEHIWACGTSSGGCATVMLAASGDAAFFDRYTEELGAADASNAVYGAMPSCPVQNRARADSALVWERWGDLSADTGASAVNKAFSADFIAYFNSLGLKAAFDVGSTIKTGDALTTDNLAEYLMVYVKSAGVKYLNSLGGSAEIEAYLAAQLGANMMYGTTAAGRDWIQPVYGSDGTTVVDIDGTWSQFWNYAVGDVYFDNTADVNFQYDRPMVAPDNCFDVLPASNGVFNENVGSGLFAQYANASSFSFGKAGDVGAVFTQVGQAWIKTERSMTISQEYQNLIALQRNSVDPTYFLPGHPGYAETNTVAEHWFMRTGTVDLVTPHPIFIGLGTELMNNGCNVDIALVWDQGHGLTSEYMDFFAFAEEAMEGDGAVVRSTQSILLDGDAVEIETYNIDGYNYFKLRDLAALLNGTAAQFSVAYDAAARAATLVTGKPYTANGTELKMGADLSASCVRSNQTIIINGKTVSVDVYNLGDYNYFKLRDLGAALGFGVGYEAASRNVLITTK